MTKKRRILAVASAALSLLASAVVLTAGSAPARAMGEVHYKINTIEFFSLPPGRNVNCHDFSNGSPGSFTACPLSQALTQANQLNASTSVRITVDWTELREAKPGGPWYIWLPAVENVVTTPMCESGCNDAGDGAGAFYTITKDNLTLDLGGSEVQDGLGILAEEAALELSTIWINSSHVTVRNVPGLYSTKSAIVIADTARDVTIENGSTDQSGTDAYHTYDYAKNYTERFVSIMGNAQDITIRNWQVGQLENHVESQYGGVVFDKDSTAKNVTIDNVVFQGSPGHTFCDSAALGCESNPISVEQGGTGTSITGLVIKHSEFSDVGRGALNVSAVTLRGATITNSTIEYCTFSNNRPLDDHGILDFSDSMVTINGFTIKGNKFLNNKVGNGPMSSVLSLPAGQAMGGMTVVGNEFVNAANSDGAAIYWDSNKGSGNKEDNSNLVIRGNHFDGFAPVTVFLKDTGLVRMEQNTFGVKSESATDGNGLSEETSTSTGLVVNDGDGANLDIETWFPIVATVDRANCALKVFIMESALDGPVDVALYATRGDDAELYLGEYPLSVAGMVTVPLEDDLLLKNPWLHAQGGNIRVQTHKAYGSGRAASQFSRWVSLPAFTCEVAYTMEKKAYSDAARTTPLPPGSVLELGSTVYFTYELTNHDTVFPTTVTVVDSMKKKVQGDDKVCVVTVDPGETDTTSCKWDHQVMRT